MISKDYKQNKKLVLELYDSFREMCEKWGWKVNPSIAEEAQKIKDDVFNLMVLGEAKSGKSTFINAYLGKEIVPMDVRQCTSAIIKINRGEEFRLIAKTAGGGRSIVEGEEEIREYLKKHAAISDKYRAIPITTINNEILIKNRGKNISRSSIKGFLEAVAEDNIHRLDSDEYNEKIINYIEENLQSWDKIITEIEIVYPLSEEMQGITLIDSPGVGAGGNVGVVAERYIKEANAIIFVKSLHGQAIESLSFMNFLRANCTEQEKNHVFLVLTGKSNLTGNEYSRVMEQATQVYGTKDLDTEKIIGVDSKVHLFLNKCRELETEEAIDEYFDRLVEAGEDFSPVSNCWLRNVKKGGVPLFEEKMEELSNFNSLGTAIEKFARRAHYLQLIAFMGNIEKEYQRYKVQDTSILTVLKENIDDPEALEIAVDMKKSEINEMYVKINQGIDAIYRKYTDNISDDAIILSEAEKQKKLYDDKLSDFKKLSQNEIDDTTFSSLKKITMDAIDGIKAFRTELAQRVIEECNQKLIQYTDDPNQISAEAYSPNFTESDFEAIDNDAREQSSGYNEVESGLTFTTVSKVPYHHLKKHVKLVVDSISTRLSDEIIPTMVDNVVEYVTKCTEIYKEQLTVHKKELENEYQRLLDNKKNNDRILSEIEEYERKLTAIKIGMTNISNLKEELGNYVSK